MRPALPEACATPTLATESATAASRPAHQAGRWFRPAVPSVFPPRPGEQRLLSQALSSRQHSAFEVPQAVLRLRASQKVPRAHEREPRDAERMWRDEHSKNARPSDWGPRELRLSPPLAAHVHAPSQSAWSAGAASSAGVGFAARPVRSSGTSWPATLPHGTRRKSSPSRTCSPGRPRALRRRMNMGGQGW